MNFVTTKEGKRAETSLNRRNLVTVLFGDGSVDLGFYIELSPKIPNFRNVLGMAIEKAQDVFLTKHSSQEQYGLGWFIEDSRTSIAYNRTGWRQNGVDNKWQLRVDYKGRFNLNVKNGRERALAIANGLVEYRELLEKELAAAGALHLLRKSKKSG